MFPRLFSLLSLKVKMWNVVRGGEIDGIVPSPVSGPLSVCIMDLALFPLASVARVTRDQGWDAVIPMSPYFYILLYLSAEHTCKS